MIHSQHGQFQIVKRRVNLLHIVQHMSLRDKKVLPAIVVKVFQADAPARASAREHAESGRETSIAESAVAVIMVDTIKLSRKLGHNHVGPAVVVIVLKDYAHAR